MENITLGQISAVVLFLGGFLGGICVLFKYIRKLLKQASKEEFDTINKNIVDLKNEINKLGISDCKNFLVSCFGKIDSGLSLDESEKERFHEVYDIYTNEYHQNSYIHERYEKFKKEGKI